jgi:glutathione S-transferase
MEGSGRERVELIQFPLSHYNEKARWALDWKRVPHRRRNLLPGPHAPVVKRLTGLTQVPVARFDEAVIAGSARILDELERRFPEPSLYPKDPALRRRALEIQAWFDEEVGPQVRRAFFSIGVREPAHLCRMFAAGHPAPVRALYRLGFPVTRLVMIRSMGIGDAAAVEAAFAGTRAALDFVAGEAGPDGHLVGDAFSVADLAAAALLAPAVCLPGTPMAQPEPRPASVRAWHERWAHHPGVAWVRDRYARFRPASVAVHD